MGQVHLFLILVKTELLVIIKQHKEIPMKMVWVISFILCRTGFLKFAPQNFSDTTLSPNGTEQATDHYQTALYEGTGSSQNVTGVGFPA